MDPVIISAPGKAMLSGEYVVLTGAPAISLALNRRVTVTLANGSGSHHEITTPGLVDGQWKFTAGVDGELQWACEKAAGCFDLLTTAWNLLRPVFKGPVRLEIDSSHLVDESSKLKLGLGSSAAVAVALATALAPFSRYPEGPTDSAFAIHREFQDGRGSGVDVATSLHGGLIAFRTGATRTIKPLAWPSGLYYRFLWSGATAATVARLELFRRAGRKDNQGQEELRDQAERVMDTWERGSAEGVLQAVQDYTAVLRGFDSASGLGIFSAGHGELLALASHCGIVYKTCGAGGGDIGVALATDENLLAGFCARAGEAGFSQLDIEPDWQGVKREARSQG